MKVKFILPIFLLFMGMVYQTTVLAQEEPSATPTPQRETVDEMALKKQMVTLPKKVEADVQPKERGFFEKVTGNIGDLFKRVFGFTPSLPEIFASRAEILHQAKVPEDLKPEKGPLKLSLPTAENLGFNTGLYSVNLPLEIQQDSLTTRDFEKLYEKAYFPQEIKPVTGQ